MSRSIDEIMDLDPLELTTDNEAIEAIIEYHRRHRANLEAGIKPKKDTGPKISLDSVMSALKKEPEEAKPTFKRRV